jgi:ATP-binding cassette subfamily C protein LapB
MQAPNGDDGDKKTQEVFETELTGSQDPLLESLLFVAESEGVHASKASLLGGLPLVDGRLTPELYVKAAAKVGLHAGVVERELPEVSSLVLPAVLLMEHNNAVVLLSIDRDKQVAELYYPLLKGQKTLSLAELEQDYTGFALYSAAKPKFDERAQSVREGTESHWFWGTLSKSWKIYRDVLIASLLINLLYRE